MILTAAIAVYLATLSDYSHQVQRVTLLTTGSLQAVALLGVGVPVVVLAARALRRLSTGLRQHANADHTDRVGTGPQPVGPARQG